MKSSPILLLVMFPAVCASAPLRGPTTTSFDFSKTTIGVDITVKGRPLHMILDTGVDPSVIDLATAESLGLKIDRGDAGADHVCIQVITDGVAPPVEAWRRLSDLFGLTG